MKIIKTYAWNRRDFSATLKCEDENCGHTQEHTSCYDDDNYYQNVVPTIPCKKCGKTTLQLGAKIDPSNLKYDPSQTV